MNERNAVCTRAPEGWWCSREGNHSGPCAARRTTRGLVEAAVKDIRPYFPNETAAWNAWNFLNTSPDFIAAILALHSEEDEDMPFPPEPEVDESAFEDVNPWRKGWFKQAVKDWLDRP